MAGSPRYVFSWMNELEFSNLRAYVAEVAMGGTISSVSGAAKSASYANMPVDDLLLEFRAENDRRNGTPRVTDLTVDMSAYK